MMNQYMIGLFGIKKWGGEVEKYQNGEMAKWRQGVKRLRQDCYDYVVL